MDWFSLIERIGLPAGLCYVVWHQLLLLRADTVKGFKDVADALRADLVASHEQSEKTVVQLTRIETKLDMSLAVASAEGSGRTVAAVPPPTATQSAHL